MVFNAIKGDFMKKWLLYCATLYVLVVIPSLIFGQTPIASTRVNEALKAQLDSDGKWISILFSDGSSQTTAGGGSVTSVSVTTANGVSGSVANPTTTPAITVSLGAITPSSVNSVVLSGTSSPNLSVTGVASVSGSNTGDQTNITGNAATVTTNANLTGHVTSTGNAAVLGSFSSANLAGALSDETGSGAAVFGTSPTLTGTVDISAGNVDLDNTTNANQFGVVSKNGTRFIHNFNYGNNGTVTTSGYNTFVGESAGNLTMGSTAVNAYEGSYNTAVGYQSLLSNTTGYQNVANGFQALYFNTTGYGNTANGYAVLNSNTSGHSNTASGMYSLLSNTTGYQNVANGFRALSSNTTGYSNTANGYAVLRYNTTGHSNTAGGMYSLLSNTTGYYNTANGFQALYSNTTGYSNTANGIDSLYYNTTGYYNTANGMGSGYNPSNDIAQYRITTDTNMVLLGRGATKDNAAQLDNGIAIGAGAHVLESNQVVLGNDSITTTLLKGSVAIGTSTPTSVVHAVGVPVYANNAAAVAGGLTAGAFYRTGADPDPVCVVH